MEKIRILLPELLPTKGIHCPDEASRENKLEQEADAQLCLKVWGSQSPQN